MSGSGGDRFGSGAMLALVAIGILGTAAELFLLGHYESIQQRIPLVLLGAGLVAVGAHTVRPGATSLRAFRTLMALFVGSGLLGIYYHFDGNAQFEIEMNASLTGLALWWESARGATPALAPGAMAFIGLVGWVSARPPRG